MSAFVPFDSMTCPLCGRRGAVPGIKRHVVKMHGQKAFDEIDWPPLRSVGQLIDALDAMTPAQVDEIAERFGITDLAASLEEIAEAAVAGT